MVCKKGLQRSVCVPCQVCEEYTHPECSNISKDLLQYLIDETKEGNAISWTCAPCHKVGKVLLNKIKALNKDVETLKKDIKDLKSDKVKIEGDIVKVDVKCDKNSNDIAGMKESVKASIFSELREREEKMNNVVIHGIPEIVEDIPGLEKKDRDMKKVIMVVNEIIEGEIEKKDIKFIKRLGEKNDDSRPILLGCKNVDLKCQILQNARMLKDSELYSDVRVGPDLTAQQRKDEKDLFSEAALKNAELSAEEALNSEWRVVGAKGSKRLVLTRKWESEGGRGTRGGGTVWRGRGRGRGHARGGGGGRGLGQREQERD